MIITEVAICHKQDLLSCKSLFYYFLVLPLLLKAVTILCLLFFHVGSVFFGASNLLEISLFGAPCSSSIKAIHFPSNVCLLCLLFPATLDISSKEQKSSAYKYAWRLVNSIPVHLYPMFLFSFNNFIFMSSSINNFIELLFFHSKVLILYSITGCLCNNDIFIQ